ncbi:MAG: hypothetical protein ISQ11_03375 [Planctomycetes bacterium]|nr:hypothetical protein [Planctomycetota bacterium]
MRFPSLGLLLLLATPSLAQGPSAGRILWLTGDAGAELRLGDQVEAWRDSSPAGHDLVQGDGSRMPAYEAHGPGGHPTLVFDGNDSLARPDGMATGSYSKVMVCAVDDFSATNNVLSGGSQHAVYFESSDLARMYHSGIFVTSGQPVGLGELVVLVATYDAQTQVGTLYQDGVQVGSGSAPPHTDTGIEVGSFGGGFGFVGRISEAMIYDRVLSAPERSAVEGYLFAKYLSSAPPEVALDRAPRSGQVLQRDGQGRAPVGFQGRVQSPGFDRVEVEVLRDGQPFVTVDQPLTYSGGEAPFSLAPRIDAGFHDYRVTVRLVAGSTVTPVAVRRRITCGDTLLIQGQSNAVAWDFWNEGVANQAQSPWIRTFGSTLDSPAVALDQGWDMADAEVRYGHAGIGQWGHVLAQRVVAFEGVPVAIINGALGGTNSTQHQRDAADPENLNTIYGRFLWRARLAGIASTARALLWYQGESDNGNEALHAQNFDLLYNDWHGDFAALEQLYVFQVRTGCGVSGRGVREVQRRLPEVYPDLQVMSTTAAPSHDGCHYRNAGYLELGERISRLVLRDLYGSTDTSNVNAPNIQSAAWVGSTRDRILLTFEEQDDALVWEPGAQVHFQLSNGQLVAGGSAVGGAILLDLPGPGSATRVSYLGHALDGPWVTNTRGVGALTFFDVPIDDCPEPPPSSFCVAAPNSVGAGASIGAGGTSSILNNDFILQVFFLPPNQIGFFFYGSAPGQVPLGDGFLCIGQSGGIQRLPVAPSNFLGSAFFPLDFGAPPLNAGAGQVVAGTHYYFQYCYRDQGAAGFNFSDGLDVSFCP